MIGKSFVKFKSTESPNQKLSTETNTITAPAARNYNFLHKNGLQSEDKNTKLITNNSPHHRELISYKQNRTTKLKTETWELKISDEIVGFKLKINLLTPPDLHFFRLIEEPEFDLLRE